MKFRNQQNAEVMRTHIEACQKSGLSVGDYCAQNGLVKSAYYYWHKRLATPNAAPGFIPVVVKSNPAGSIAITYPNGVQLNFSGIPDASIIKALVCCI